MMNAFHKALMDMLHVHFINYSTAGLANGVLKYLSCAVCWMLTERRKNGATEFAACPCPQLDLLCWGSRRVRRTSKTGDHSSLSYWSSRRTCAQSTANSWRFPANLKPVWHYYWLHYMALINQKIAIQCKLPSELTIACTRHTTDYVGRLLVDIVGRYFDLTVSAENVGPCQGADIVARQ